jgi:hypothetical protein
MANRPRTVAFGPAAAKRIAASVLRTESTAYDATSDRRPRGAGWNPGVLRAIVTTAIPTGTMGTPSSTGRVTIRNWNPQTATDSAGLTSVKVLNDMTISASIAVNKMVKVAWIDGDFWLVSAECP